MTGSRTRTVVLRFVILAAVIGGLLHGSRPAAVGRTALNSRPPATQTLATLPPAAQAAVSRVVGRDDRSYQAVASALGFTISNPRQELEARFTSQGVDVRSGHAHLIFSLSGWGYGETLRPIGSTEPRAAQNRIEYVHDSLVEWYVNGPLGIEQGFTLSERPGHKGREPLSLALSVSGDLKPSLADNRQELSFSSAADTPSVRYSGLVATDASGRDLRAWLELVDQRILVRVDDADAHYPIEIDPYFQQAKLTPSDLSAGFVAISGDTVVVGAPGLNGAQGAAYVFVKPPSGWTTAVETAKLTASDGALEDFFGFGVGVSGGTIVVGVPGKDSAYVFVKPNDGWVNATETAKLTASDGVASDEFGTGVAISGDTIVVGAPSLFFFAGGVPGAAYVFEKPNGGWTSTTQTAKLTASDGLANDALGIRVAISGDVIVAGAEGDDSNRGSAYVFVRPLGGWTSTTQTAKLTASDRVGGAYGGPYEGDFFGLGVAVNGDTIAVLSYSTSYQGSCYVFVKPLTGWSSATQSAKLTASDTLVSGEDAGFAGVAILGDTIVAGRGGEQGNRGAAYVFVKPVAGWTTNTETQRLTASDGAAADYFGAGVAISDAAIVVSSVTAAYVFGSDSLPPTTTTELTPAAPNGAHGWYVSNVHAKVTATDEAGGSGVAETRCVLDPASAPASFDDLSAGCPFTGTGADVSVEGTHTLWTASEDVAGNTGTPGSTSFKLDKTNPTLTVANVTANATGPGGTLVSTYPASASDNLDPAPALSCVPAAPHVFAIGDTEVACTAQDTAGNTSGASFTVHVAGASEQTAALLSLVNGIAPGTSLSAKLLALQAALAGNKTSSACGALAAFINEVNAQRGKNLTPSQAAAILAPAIQIRTVLGC